MLFLGNFIDEGIWYLRVIGDTYDWKSVTKELFFVILSLWWEWYVKKLFKLKKIDQFFIRNFNIEAF